MKGRWLLATNGRRHYFRTEKAKISVCGCMPIDRCYPEEVKPTRRAHDWPCSTCTRYAKKIEQEKSQCCKCCGAPIVQRKERRPPKA